MIKTIINTTAYTKLWANLVILLSAAMLFTGTIEAQRRVSTKSTKFQGMTYSGSSMTDLDDLRNIGANLVGYQLILFEEADNFTLEQYNQKIEERLVVLDSVLTRAESLQMKVLINLHTPPGAFASRVGAAQHRIFSDRTFQDALITLWGKIAQRYAGRTGVYGYDILNEPAQRRVEGGARSWNELAPLIVQEIRKYDPTRLVLVMPLYGNPDNFKKLTPVNDKYIGYNFHQYYTAKFRTQGFFGRPINVLYPKGDFNKKALENSVKKAVNFQKRTRKPMMCGEFAAPRWAFKNSALRYLRDTIKVFRGYKWDWANHAWREDNAWSMEHTNVQSDQNKSATPTDRQLMFEGFFQKNN